MSWRLVRFHYLRGMMIMAIIEQTMLRIILESTVLILPLLLLDRGLFNNEWHSAELNNISHPQRHSLLAQLGVDGQVPNSDPGLLGENL